MLTVKECQSKLHELRISQRKCSDLGWSGMGEYLTHLQRLIDAYEKEYVKALQREQNNGIDRFGI